MKDLFGEDRVDIPGNTTLATMANIIVGLTKMDPTLLDGSSINEIDKKLRLAVWKEQGLVKVLGDRMEAFEEWFNNAPFIDPEIIRRTRQYLVQHDFIRLSAEAVRDAERKRGQVTSAFSNK